MSWADVAAYGFDVETTGIDVLTDRIVTATVVKVVDGAAVDKRTWLINPGVPIPEGATRVHGITNEKAQADGMDPALAVADIADTVAGVLRSELPLVAFNAAYDLSILEAECRRHKIPGIVDVPLHSAIDPMVLGKGLDMIGRNFRKGRKYTLPALCERFNVPFVESHDATADAHGAVNLARAIGKSEAHLLEMGPGALHQLQVTWRREDQIDFRRWAEKNGRLDDFPDIDDGWPLHTRLQAVTV